MVCLNDVAAFAQKAIFVCCFSVVFNISTLEAQQLVRVNIPVVATPAVSVPVTSVPVSSVPPASVSSIPPASSVPSRSANAASGGWYPYVIAREQDRAWIRDMPVGDRPNRPLHFWGNSRRRLR